MEKSMAFKRGEEGCRNSPNIVTNIVIIFFNYCKIFFLQYCKIFF